MEISFIPSIHPITPFFAGTLLGLWLLILKILSEHSTGGKKGKKRRGRRKRRK